MKAVTQGFGEKLVRPLRGSELALVVLLTQLRRWQRSLPPSRRVVPTHAGAGPVVLHHCVGASCFGDVVVLLFDVRHHLVVGGAVGSRYADVGPLGLFLPPPRGHGVNCRCPLVGLCTEKRE